MSRPVPAFPNPSIGDISISSWRSIGRRGQPLAPKTPSWSPYRVAHALPPALRLETRHTANLLLFFSYRAHPAEEVYVTGTFDDWTKSEKLEKVGDKFEKNVTLADASKKIYYKVGAHAFSFVCPGTTFPT